MSSACDHINGTAVAPGERPGVTATATNPVHADASRYVAADLSVIPVKLDGSKSPAEEGWRVFSNRLPTAAELANWFLNQTRARYGIGITCGPASGHLVVLDFETRAAFDRWCELLTDDDKSHLVGSPIVRTPRDGIHVYLRLTDSVKGTKYARTATGECLIETRGNGHQVVAPGSPASVHPTGRPYTFIRRGWIDGPRTEPVPLDVFHSFTVYMASLNEYSKPATREVVGDRPAGGEIGSRPGDHFNTRITWGDILGRQGWKVYRSAAGVTYWSRPGKSPAGISASTGHCQGPSGNDLFYCFTSSAPPFEAGLSYSRFGVYSLLYHHGNFAAAARTLGLADYGLPKKVVRP